MSKTTVMTYKVFAELAIKLALGKIDEDFNKEAFIEKANKLIDRETKKTEYSQENKKPSVSKVSEATKENAALILSVLSKEPMTTSEINEALNRDFEPLQISNAIRFIEKSTEIIRTKKIEVVTKIKNGVPCQDQSPRAAYAINNMGGI